MFDELVKSLIEQAEKTGEAQKIGFESPKWQPIVKDGKKVGRYRFTQIEISVSPIKQRQPRKAGKR